MGKKMRKAENFKIGKYRQIGQIDACNKTIHRKSNKVQ